VLSLDLSSGFEEVKEVEPEPFLGQVVILDTIEALQQVQESRPGLTLWSDGSRPEDGRVGAGVVWKSPQGSWRTQEFPLGKGKEVHDAKLYGAYMALETALRIGGQGPVTVLLDSQAAIARLQHTEPGPEQAVALQIHKAAQSLYIANREAIIQWIPGHHGAEGNEQADQAAKRAAARPARGQGGELSLAHVSRTVTETRVEARQSWLSRVLSRRSAQAQRAYRPSKG
jgi:ribonuclease HI